MNEIKLTECFLNEGASSPMEIEPTVDTVGEEEDANKPADVPAATKRPIQKSKVRPAGSCALPLE